MPDYKSISVAYRTKFAGELRVVELGYMERAMEHKTIFSAT